MSVSNHPLDMNEVIDTAVLKVADADSFLWKDMDDVHVIYDIRSGYSQVANDFAHEIFDIIEEKPRCLMDVVTELQSILGHVIEDDLKQQIRETVVKFDKMGLIEPWCQITENKK